MTTPATKIVIVAGQEFSVPAETENEAIKAQLLAMGFTDVASATIQKGTRDGVETIEFVKKAGTKGLGGADLAALLAGLPSAPLDQRLGQDSAALLARLTAAQMTIGEALAHGPDLREALDEVGGGYHRPSEGAALCDRVDHAPAAPCAIPCAW